MKLSHLLPFVFLALASLAGCMNPAMSPTSTAPTTNTTTEAKTPCVPVYFDECDNNPDAAYMLKTYGLHQITNTTYNVGRPTLESGWIAWTQGGFGNPLDIHAFSITSKRHYSFEPPPRQIYSYGYPFNGTIIYSLSPFGDYLNTTLWLWNPSRGSHTQVNLPEEVGVYMTSEKKSGFDGQWALLNDLPPPVESGIREQDGAMAVNVITGAYRRLFEVRPTDSTYFGSPLLLRTLSNGSAFLNYYYENPDRTGRDVLQEVNLTTGQNKTILELPNQLFQQFDASDDYVVVPAGVSGGSLAIMSRHNYTWWDLVKDPNVEVTAPVVDGDWCVYLEATYDRPDGPTVRLVGIHLPDGQRHTLLTQNPDVGIASFDTDGKYVVALLQPSSFDSSLRYPHAQIYWMELPASV